MNFRWQEITSITTSTHTIKKLVTKQTYSARVKAHNSTGTSPTSESTEFTLKKQVDKEAPSVQQPLKDIATSLDQNVTLTCVFGGVPVPTVEWFKDGVVLKQNMTYENRLATLIIREVKETSIGKYSCKAVNELGQAETSCNLTASEKPAIVIEEKLLNQKLKVGSQWTVVAQIKGYPFPKITWLKNDQSIDKSQDVKVVSKENTSTITIKTTKRSSTGKYTIRAENEFGSDAVELNLRIFGELVLSFYFIFCFHF